VVALAPVVSRAGVWRLPLAIVGGVLLLAGCVFVFPRLLEPSRAPQDFAGLEGLSAKDRVQFAADGRRLQNEVRTSLLQAVAGGAVLVGVLFTWQQQQATLQQQQATNRQIADQLTITRQGQVGERFSRAVDQLGSDSIDVRLGGLYELEQLARQAPERHQVIIEVVGAFIREHARRPAKVTTPRTRPAQDVAAALAILGRRSIENGEPLADLHGVDLGRADIGGASLVRVDLRGASLADASLVRVDLRGASLVNANLQGVLLVGANLDGARLSGTDLRGANLRGASLRGALANHATQWPHGFDVGSAGIEQED